MHLKFSNQIKRMSKRYFHNATLKWNLMSLSFKFLVGRLLKMYLHKITPLKTCEIGNRPVHQSSILCVHTIDWHVSLKICHIIHHIHRQLKNKHIDNEQLRYQISWINLCTNFYIQHQSTFHILYIMISNDSKTDPWGTHVVHFPSWSNKFEHFEFFTAPFAPCWMSTK